jgi:hypothetical protein
VGQKAGIVVGRLLNFLIAVVVILFVAWLMTVIIGFIPVIPEELKGITEIVIWFVAFICILVCGKRVFVDGTTVVP